MICVGCMCLSSTLVYSWEVTPTSVAMATLISEMSSLLKQYKIKEKDVNREVTDIHIDKISQSHCKKWKSLPAYLEMENMVASDIDDKNIDGVNFSPKFNGKNKRDLKPPTKCSSELYWI